jgi:Integrase core domain/ABC transporter
VIGGEGYKFIIHDRDNIYSREVDSSLRTLGLRVLKTPYRSPQANAFCERLIGSARRECLDFMIPINEGHVRWIMKQWTTHYNQTRPHSSLGPGIPDANFQKAELQSKRHCIPQNHRVSVTPILGGLHHEYDCKKLQRECHPNPSRIRSCFCGPQGYRTLLMTSHDREFMNRVVSRIAESDGGEITVYSGNYDFYARERQIRETNREAAYAQVMLAKEQRFIERFSAHHSCIYGKAVFTGGVNAITS